MTNDDHAAQNVIENKLRRHEDTEHNLQRASEEPQSFSLDSADVISASF